MESRTWRSRDRSIGSRTPGRGGYLLVSLLGPLFGAGLAVGLSVWLIASRWSTFSPGMQSGLKVAGVLAGIGLVGVNVWTASKGRGNRRGF